MLLTGPANEPPVLESNIASNHRFRFKFELIFRSNHLYRFTDDEFGFRKNHSTASCTHVLKQSIIMFREVVMCFVLSLILTKRLIMLIIGYCFVNSLAKLQIGLSILLHVYVLIGIVTRRCLFAGRVVFLLLLQ